MMLARKNSSMLELVCQQTENMTRSGIEIEVHPPSFEIYRWNLLNKIKQASFACFILLYEFCSNPGSL